MAKKRKQKEPEVQEEDIEIELPPFDDEAFMKEETRGGKVTFISVGYGFLCGIISFFIYLISQGIWQIPVVIGILLMAGIFGLLMFFKIDIQELNWKNYVGAGVTYLATWMIVFTILLNTPFYDRQPPEIHSHELYTFDEDNFEFIKVNQSGAMEVEANNTIFVVITDNSEVDSYTIAVTHESGSVVTNGTFEKVTGNHPWQTNRTYKEIYDMSDNDYVRFSDYRYEYKIPMGLAVGSYTYEITAKDAKDHETSKSGDFYLGRNL